MQKLLVILGPTATGKSSLAIELAKRYNGEVISADSRQVYKGMDLGTGKVTKKEMSGIPHHMLDVVSPKTRFSISDWQKQTKKIIADILSRKKLSIICGGTGFYIQSIVDGIVLPEVAPDFDLRRKLEKKTTPELFSLLKKLDPERAETIDQKNPVRLIRAIEIAKALGKVPKVKNDNHEYEVLQIGLELPENELKKRISSRLLERIKQGMIGEAKKLHQNGLTWKRMFELGLEYRYQSLFLQNKITKEELIDKLNLEIWHYAKRQMTWFKRDQRIKWFKPRQIKNIEETLTTFLKKD